MHNAPGVKPGAGMTADLRERAGRIVRGEDARYGNLFDHVIITIILASIAALALETLPGIPAWLDNALDVVELTVVIIFTLEYGLRLWTARQPLRYATSFWGIVDLLTVLPFWLTIGGNFQALRSLRLMRILRINKLVRHVAAINRISRAFQLIKEELAVFGLLALILMFIAAVGIYEFEHEAQPQAFASIPHALWFVVVTLTTVGYGDVYPVTAGGKMFTFFILIIGIGVIALPTGLISSGLNRAREEERAQKNKGKDGQETQNTKHPPE